MLGLSVEHCATICNTTPNAVRVADGRGRRELDNYLGARCEHLDPGNACHCVARLGNALEQGLVAWPRHNEHDGVPFTPEVHRDASQLYARQPRVRCGVPGTGGGYVRTLQAAFPARRGARMHPGERDQGLRDRNATPRE